MTITYSKEFLSALAIQTWEDREDNSDADYEALMAEDLREIDIEPIYEEMAYLHEKETSNNHMNYIK
ncbi:hypothetical protein PN499_22170 [Kamptonema animale CS-326]|uniref:hypothetical protein n=1 Tax=Kamptonema animale TaxID=92934 RepID=UPI00232C19D0|nr:hypothetical protein [Kamptonema animale]MDB9513910.1 hypothetical protein [Kamptonema animale CS-326]